MARYILIDHGLNCVGGHNFQYALDVLGAAERQGYQPVLATHHSLSPAHFPQHWTVLPVFDYRVLRAHQLGVDGKSRYAVDIQGRPLTAAGSRISFRPLEQWRQRRRVKQLQQFVAGCSAVFEQVGWNAEDRVFLPTLKEFGVLGLVRFLKENPESAALDWHLQFHFDVFFGRETEHAAQHDRRERLHRQLHAALSEAPEHRFHFYATTAAMCRQYNRLQVSQFQHLPYPVGEVFRRRCEEKPIKQPLRVACAGMVRREKYGYSLTDFLSDTSDLFEQRKIQLAVQVHPNRVKRYLGKAGLDSSSVSEDSAADDRSAVVVVKHPLSTEQYVQFIRGADIGLFLYDSDRYHSRASGILLEMLSSGIPVIVPGGCWLSDQIQLANYQHAAAIEASATTLAPLEPLAWGTIGREPQALEASEPLTCGESGRILETIVSVPNGCDRAVLSWNWNAEALRGQYVRLTVQPRDAQERELGDRQEFLLGPGIDGNQRPASLFSFPDGTASCSLQLANHYADLPISIDELRLNFLASEVAAGAPLGCVGLIAADPQQIPALLREMHSHYEHYRVTAEQFAVEYAEKHAPERTLEILEANCRVASDHSRAA